MKALIKIIRFVRIYGIRRTVIKVLGRSRFPVRMVWRSYPKPDVALIGCGQFGFTTLGFFLSRRFGRRVLWCFDTDAEAARTCAKVLGAHGVAATAEDAITGLDTAYVYIASNHASHTDYAVRAMKAGKVVYVEKPVSVTPTQLTALETARRKYDGEIYAGYNRPHSDAIQQVRGYCENLSGGLSLTCFVSGHIIPADHWYRKPEEGTRICGNAGHWIDLFVHMLSWREIPDVFRIQLLPANASEPDDNFSLSIATEMGDVFTLMLTARTEPIEGINETINMQWGDTIAKVDDFRRMTLWRGTTIKRFRFWPKDVGHRRAVLQPFGEAPPRAWSEIVKSSILMLRVTDMVRNGETECVVSLNKQTEDLGLEADIR